MGSGSFEKWLHGHNTSFLIAVGVFLGGCGVGIIAAFGFLSPDEAVGPLSEWVPGTVTALALAYTLISQRQSNQERHDEDRKREVARERSQAEHVFVWIERRQGVNRVDYCVLRWSNTSDAPAYLCDVHLELAGGRKATVSIGTIPPQERLGERELPHYTIPTGVDAAREFPAGAGCVFRDAGNRMWQRDAAGTLSRAS